MAHCVFGFEARVVETETKKNKIANIVDRVVEQMVLQTELYGTRVSWSDCDCVEVNGPR